MIPMIPRYHDHNQAATWVGDLMGVMGLLLGGIGVCGTTVLANFVPALRAARVDPARVLKEE
jgi:ABC-type lipoprotein release transport system permease subunit